MENYLREILCDNNKDDESFQQYLNTKNIKKQIHKASNDITVIDNAIQKLDSTNDPEIQNIPKYKLWYQTDDGTYAPASGELPEEERNYYQPVITKIKDYELTAWLENSTPQAITVNKPVDYLTLTKLIGISLLRLRVENLFLLH